MATQSNPLGAIVKQETFSLGEVDQALYKETGHGGYLKSAKSLFNFYVNQLGKAAKRPGTLAVGDETGDNRLIINSVGTNLLSITTLVDGNFYLVLFTQKDDPNRIALYADIYRIDFSGGNPVIVREKKTKANPAGKNGFVSKDVLINAPVSLDDADITASAKFIVIAHRNMPTMHLQIETDGEGGLDADKIQANFGPINFLALPSADRQRVDYTSVNFTFKETTSGGGQAVVQTDASTLIFDPAIYIGGTIINLAVLEDKKGNPLDNVLPQIGVGIITKITGGVDGVNLAFEINQIQRFYLVDSSADVRLAGSSKWIIKEPLFGDLLGWPGTVTFFQERLWLGDIKSAPDSICASVPFQYNNFNVFSEAGEASVASSAISYNLGVAKGERIRHIRASRLLHIWTDNRQFTSPASLTMGITPVNFSVHETSQYATGASRPEVYQNRIYFAAGNGKSVARIEEDPQKAVTTIISSDSEHLIKNPVKMVAAQIRDTQESLLTIINKDGTLAIFSNDDGRGINAFTPYRYSLPVHTSEEDPSITMPYTISDIVSIRDTVMIITRDDKNTLRLFEVNNSVFMDFGVRTTLTEVLGPVSAASASIPPWLVNTGDIIILQLGTSSAVNLSEGARVIYRGVAKSNTIVIPEGSVGSTIYIGKPYRSTLQTLDLWAGKKADIAAHKTATAWISYTNSAVFTVNGEEPQIPLDYSQGKPFLVLHSGTIVPDSGTMVLSLITNPPLTSPSLTIESNAPFPLTVQTLSWSVTPELVN